MMATIWTASSGTTGTLDEDTSIKEYYQGATFRPVEILQDKLDDCCETNLYVLLDGGRYVRGNESSVILLEQNNAEEELDGKFIDSTVESDITVILLPSDIFDDYVVANWDQIVARAKPNTIWCIGTSKGSLAKIDIQKLEKKGCDILLYERSGVAPIGREVRAQLLQKVRDRVS